MINMKTKKTIVKSRLVELIQECYDFPTYKEALLFSNDDDFIRSDDFKDIRDYLLTFDN